MRTIYNREPINKVAALVINPPQDAINDAEYLKKIAPSTNSITLTISYNEYMQVKKAPKKRRTEIEKKILKQIDEVMKFEYYAKDIALATLLGFPTCRWERTDEQNAILKQHKIEDKTKQLKVFTVTI